METPHDSGIVLKEKGLPAAGQKTLYLQGLDCADCAQKIVNALERLDGVRAVHLDFVTQRLSLEANDQSRLPALLRQAVQVVSDVEPGVTVSMSAPTADNSPRGGSGRQFLRVRLAVGALFFVSGLLFVLPPGARLGLFLGSYLLIGGDILLQALKNVLKGHVFDENFLMSLASIGAFTIGEYPEGVAVMLFYQIGVLLQNRAVGRSRRSIAALMDIRPDYANLQIGDTLHQVPPETVGVGARIVVKPGERLPLDGQVIDGNASLDLSALTGESFPRDVGPGDEVLSGSINKNGLLTVAVTKEFEESTLAKILDLVQNAGSKKAPAENFITIFARYYTPVVVLAAAALALLPPLILPDAAFSTWLHRALVFLVVSCPCALVISIPLSFFGGIGGASRKGILIKGGNYLEALSKVSTVVFDKTGTLTKGHFQVADVVPANGWKAEALLEYAAYAEKYSTHPIADSIRLAYGRSAGSRTLSAYEEIPGQGVRVMIDGRLVLAGSSQLLLAAGIMTAPAAAYGTLVHLAVDGTYAGHLVIADELKPDSREAVAGLRALGVQTIALFTGDAKAVGEKIARDVGVDSVYTELLPHQKVEQLEALIETPFRKRSSKVVFVGDGINDAPVLARADVGVAMGGLGSDAAIEAADVVLMTDEPSKLVTAVRIARRTHAIVWQNIIFALGVKAVLLGLGALGIATMWAAVFGDVGVALIAIFNSMRCFSA